MAQDKRNANRVSYITVFTAVFIAIFLLVYFIVGRPVLKYADSLKFEFSRKQAKLQEAQELVKALPDPQKAIAEIKSKLQELQESGVSKKQVPRLMQLLGTAAGDKSVTVVSLRQREDIKSDSAALPEGINKVYLEIVVLCNYQELAEYIKAAGELPPAFNVESLNVEKQADAAAPLEAKSGAKSPSAPSGLLKATIVFSAISG
jgi:Tfp pilus assembly protein PilO